MKIKTTEEIIEEMKTAFKIVHSRQSVDYSSGVLNDAVTHTENNKKKWVAVDEVIKEIKKGLYRDPESSIINVLRKLKGVK